MVSLAVGATAGTLATVLIWNFFLVDRTNQLLTSRTLPPSTHRRVATSDDELVAKLREEATLSIVDFFAVKNDEAARYFPDEAIGHGVVLSSDGWILSSRSVFDPRRASMIRVGVGPFLAPIDRVVQDTETGALFIKVAHDNLRPAVFGSTKNLSSGDTLYLVTSAENLARMHVAELRNRRSGIVSSDILSTSLTFVQSVAANYTGSPVFDSVGNVVGIAVTDGASPGRAIPLDDLTPLFHTFLANGTLTRPALGVHGVNLTNSRQFPDVRGRGFLVMADPKFGNRAVDRGSPADRAGIIDRDIITKVRDVPVVGALDISELLLALEPGDAVDFTIVRGGSERMITVTLGTRTSSKSF